MWTLWFERGRTHPPSSHSQLSVAVLPDSFVVVSKLSSHTSLRLPSPSLATGGTPGSGPRAAAHRPSGKKPAGGCTKVRGAEATQCYSSEEHRSCLEYIMRSPGFHSGKLTEGICLLILATYPKITVIYNLISIDKRNNIILFWQISVHRESNE